ncbi:putative N-acetyltransferase 8B [Erinaceus europaeus]|uniref:N-acetyltransferase 8B n=1 Tax=Erinaceus europaeus TaxID=9365 RepID=A0A1S2ZSB1_ERIEU|nr:putative N-acetyltransferase 8B [Erinaceus europaeus]
MPSMAPYHIRKYQERDDECVRDLYSKGMAEHVPTAFCHILKLPRTLVLLLGAPVTVLLLTGSWLLPLLVTLTVLTALLFVAKYPWMNLVAVAFNTDMSDITKNYFSERGSCFWVAESEGQVVGMVGALPMKDPALREKTLELLHLCVSSQHRGQGIAKALIRTVLQFGQDQGYSAVVLDTSVLQQSALGLYQSMGFQKKGRFFFSFSMRLAAIDSVLFQYRIPSVQDSKLLRQRKDL